MQIFVGVVVVFVTAKDTRAQPAGASPAANDMHGDVEQNLRELRSKLVAGEVGEPVQVLAVNAPAASAEPSAEPFRQRFDREQKAFQDKFDKDERDFDAKWKRDEEKFDRDWNAFHERLDTQMNRFWLLYIAAGLAALGWLGYTLQRKARVTKDKPDLLGKQARAIVSSLASAGPKRADGVLAGFVAGEAVNVSIEDRAVVIGPPGTGKTAFLVAQLLRWAESRRSFVCLDIKPEIYGITRERLEGLGYRVLTFNPTAATGQRYNLLDDVDSAEGLGELAAALIPGDDLRNAVFYESARDFLDAVVSHLRATTGKASLVDVRSFLGEGDGFEELMQKLLKSPDPDVVDIAGALTLTAANNRLIGSICAQLRANLRFVRYPNIRESLERSDFSLRQLCGKKPVALFLQFEEGHRETTARLLAAMVAHVLRYFILHTDRDPVLLMLDEIGTAPVIPSLVQKLNTIRSRKLPTWMYWQSLEQMQAYGVKADEGPNIILGACDMQMVFRLNDNASALWMSDRIGKVDREVEAVSVKIGQFAQTSRDLVTEPIVWPHELQALAANEVVCTYRGNTWRGLARPYFELWPEYRNKRPAATRGAAYPALPANTTRDEQTLVIDTTIEQTE